MEATLNVASIIGYEPVDLTVHPPPHRATPKTIEGGFIFFRIGV